MEINEIQNFIRELTEGYIDWGELSTQIRTWLLPYEIRIFAIITALVLLILVNLLWFYKKKSKGRIKVIDRGDKTLSIKYIRKRIRFLPVNHPLWIHKYKIINISLCLFLFFMILSSVLFKPLVIRSTPKEESYMRSGAEPIELIFDVPFDTEQLEFNLSPDIGGEWVIDSVFERSPFKRKARFIPNQSIYPGKPVVVYLVGLRPWFGLGKLHEQSIEFKSPRVPSAIEYDLKDKEVNVPTNKEISLTYDAPIGDFVKLEVTVEPETPVELISINDQKQKLKFPEGLEQDQKYTVAVYRTPRSYDLQSNEDIVLGDTEVLNKVEFQTVTTPFVESVEPEGSSVLVDSPVKIVFDQPMDKTSVGENFTIEPSVEGVIEWEDDRTMFFRPKKELPKETSFNVKLAVGVASTSSGVISEEIAYKFQTIGKVKVVSTSPVNGTTGHNPNSTNIAIQFDQEVDKASAQSKFSISPATIGVFKWEGSKMIYQTAGKLKYSTKYSYSVGSGVKSISGLDSDKSYSFSFTTKANVFTIAVPQYHQQEGFTCNISATRMALAYRGVYVTEATVKNGVGIGSDPNADWVPGYGVHVGPIASYIGQYRKVSIKKGWNVAEIAKEVEKGNPVIVWWYNRFSLKEVYTLPSGVTAYRGMHSEVVVGFIGDSSNPSTLLTNDPWRGRQSYTPGQFNAIWSYLGYTALIVY